MSEQASSHMSAEWWHREADRYCQLHIAAHQRLVELEAENRRLQARLGRLAIVTPYGPEWIAEHYPDWLVIDSDDGITMAGGTCYLLERLPESQIE